MLRVKLLLNLEPSYDLHLAYPDAGRRLGIASECSSYFPAHFPTMHHDLHRDELFALVFVNNHPCPRICNCLYGLQKKETAQTLGI